MKSLTKIFALTAVTSLLALQVATPFAGAQLFQNAKGEACKGAQLNDENSGCNQGQAARVNTIIEVGLNIFSIVIAIIAVIMLMVNGLKFILADGDSNKIAEARKGIIFALIGLAVVALAQSIVQFVIGRIT